MSPVTMSAPHTSPELEPREPRETRVRETTVRESAVREMIAIARSAPAPAFGAIVLSCVTGLLMWGAFTPLDFGPLGWVCLIPLMSLIRLERPTKSMYRSIWLGGLAFWVPTLQWMRLGDPMMFIAWFALALYLSFYFPAFVALSRVAVRRLKIPMLLAAPVVWVGLELLRGHLMTGFGWYYLGHSQYRWIEMIQLSDVFGAYGVSFLMVMFTACAVELLPVGFFQRMKLFPSATAVSPVATLDRRICQWQLGVCLMLFFTALGYGYTRRSQADFQPGPRVALIQSNVPSEIKVKHDPQDMYRNQRRHEELMGKSVLHHPDFVVWPETMFPWELCSVADDISDAELQRMTKNEGSRSQDLPVRKKLSNLSQMAGAALVMGLVWRNFDRQERQKFNSACFVRPDTSISGRYDKIHRVMFGEYIPLVDYIPALQGLATIAAGYNLSAGTAPVAFEYKGYRCAPLICFEDTVPHLVRNIINETKGEGKAEGQRVDFLVNLTNDGWFHGSSELDQHLITAAFRSVECRTPMVRAVNTGISAFIDGDGVIRNRAVDSLTGKSKQIETFVVDTVPLDHRQSLYLKFGDWFAGLCMACCGCLACVPVVSRWIPSQSRIPSVVDDLRLPSGD